MRLIIAFALCFAFFLRPTRSPVLHSPSAPSLLSLFSALSEPELEPEPELEAEADPEPLPPKLDRLRGIEGIEGSDGIEGIDGIEGSLWRGMDGIEGLDGIDGIEGILRLILCTPFLTPLTGFGRFGICFVFSEMFLGIFFETESLMRP